MQYSPSGLVCHTLAVDGESRLGDFRLTSSAFAYTVRGLVLLYNRKLTARVDWNSMGDVQAAVDLSTRQSVLDADNWGCYA